MNRKRLSILGLAAAIFATLPTHMQRHILPTRGYRSARSYRTTEDSAQRIAAAQAKRDRRMARNRALAAAEIARKRHA